MDRLPTHKGNVVLTHGSDRQFHIRIQDDNGAVIVEAAVPADNAYELFATMHAGCSYQVVAPHNAGKTHEHKTVNIKVEGYGKDPEADKALLAPHEVDGWRGRASDLRNMHRRSGSGHASVTFSRYVD